MAVLELCESHTLALRGASCRLRSLARALTDVSSNSDTAKIKTGKCSDSADRQPALQWKWIAVNPSTDDEATVELAAWRDSVVTAKVDEGAAICEALNIGRHVIRANRSTGELEISSTALILGVQVPSRPWPQNLVSGVEVEIQSQYMNETVVDARIHAP